MQHKDIFHRTNRKLKTQYTLYKLCLRSERLNKHFERKSPCIVCSSKPLQKIFILYCNKHNLNFVM